MFGLVFTLLFLTVAVSILFLQSCLCVFFCLLVFHCLALSMFSCFISCFILIVVCLYLVYISCVVFNLPPARCLDCFQLCLVPHLFLLPSLPLMYILLQSSCVLLSAELCAPKLCILFPIDKRVELGRVPFLYALPGFLLQRPGGGQSHSTD